MFLWKEYIKLFSYFTEVKISVLRAIFAFFIFFIFLLIIKDLNLRLKFLIIYVFKNKRENEINNLKKIKVVVMVIFIKYVT